MWEAINKIASHLEAPGPSDRPSGSRAPAPVPAGSEKQPPLLPAQPQTAGGGLGHAPPEGSVYRRVTVPTCQEAPATAAPVALDQLPFAVSEPSSANLGFVGAPRGSSAPEIFPGQFPTRISDKIANDEYVDFADLLTPDFRRYGVVLDNDRELNLVTKKPKVLSQSQWIRAFCLYSIEYLAHYPDAKIDLFIYALKITDLMEEPGMDWRFYDSTFRMDRKKLGLSFRQMRMDLERKASRPSSAFSGRQELGSGLSGQPFRLGGGRSAELPAPPGYCFSFHEGAGCFRERCVFKHECPRCGVRHPASDGRCPGRSGKRFQSRNFRGSGKSPRGHPPQGKSSGPQGK